MGSDRDETYRLLRACVLAQKTVGEGELFSKSTIARKLGSKTGDFTFEQIEILNDLERKGYIIADKSDWLVLTEGADKYLAELEAEIKPDSKAIDNEESYSGLSSKEIKILVLCSKVMGNRVSFSIHEISDEFPKPILEELRSLAKWGFIQFNMGA
jgi:hypothetical protein